MRIAVVDDRDDVREGRAGWLADAGHVVTQLSFDEALTSSAWLEFDVVVLDGRDDRETPVLAPGGLLPDRFLGPRVAHQIRSTCGEHRVRTVLISAYVRTHPDLSLRCQQAGVDYAFDYVDVATKEQFVAAVEAPDRLPRRAPASWRERGHSKKPDIQRALEAAESSPATPGLLSDNALRGAATAYERRTLREKLGKYLAVPTPLAPGQRQRNPHEREIRPFMQRLLGLRRGDMDGDSAADGDR